MSTTLAPETELSALTAEIAAATDGTTRAVDDMLVKYPEDPRLHFLRGSLLAATGRAIEAHRSLARAVELAPGYSLARYQLGFFELTSGEPEQALGTWGPLLAEGEGSYLRKFVEGMTHLIRDEFQSAILRFEEGIGLNQANEPMNGDVRLLMAECRKLANAEAVQNEAGEHSATSLLLGRLSSTKTVQ